MTTLLREPSFTRSVSVGHSLFVFLTALAGCAAPAATPAPVGPVQTVQVSAPPPGGWPTEICPRAPIPLHTEERVSSNAGVYTHGWFVPSPSFLKTVSTPFELRIGNEKRSYPPSYACIKDFGVARKAGEDGAKGASGGTGFSAAPARQNQFALAPTRAGDGWQGEAGSAGKPGAEGAELRVFATLVKTRFHAKLVAFTVEGAAQDFLLVPFGAPVTIHARGSAGGAGGIGGAGGGGADGETTLGARKVTPGSEVVPTGPGKPLDPNGRLNTKVNGASGGNGGIGGTGGAGGNGGAGGAIVLYVDRRFPEIRNQVTLDVSGGKGGAGGPGGPGGLGGTAAKALSVEHWVVDRTDWRAPKDGSVGEPGAGGASGTDGPTGTATVLLDDIAIAPIPGIEML